jgi:nucleotide-binding universal stress UspA family protein
MGKHVLIPLDGSDSSWEAFDFALDEHREDSLTILHVINPMEGDYEPDEATNRAVKRSDRIQNEAENRIRNSAFDDSRADIVTREGQPADEIVTYADSHDIDQIVMGSRGLSGVKRLLLGSVAETVVRRAEAPVNVIR